MKMLINNKKAYFNYEILDKLEAGINLLGWEVKSIKKGSMNITGAYVKEKGDEMYLVSARVPLWKFAQEQNKELENRDRKLLLHKSQAKNFAEKAKVSGATIVPLELYTNDKGIIKILIALAKGKKKFDKRSKLKDRDVSRKIEQERKQYNF